MKPWKKNCTRIGRAYFWTAYLLTGIISKVILTLIWMSPKSNEVTYVSTDDAGNTITNTVINDFSTQIYLLMLFIFLSVLAYQIPLIIKRYHDAGYSTLSAILTIITIPIVVGDIALIVIGCQPSDDDNEWGVNCDKQKYIDNRDVYGA